MLRRHHILSATMLALAATMSEEDSPVVPSPDDLDALPEPRMDDWSTPLDDSVLSDIKPSHLRTGTSDDSMRFLLRSWERDRPKQRASKKVRAARKAKKGWA